MNSTLTLRTTHVNTARTQATKKSVAARLSRTLACKWDLFAIAGLMVSSTVYGVYALTQMTGF